MKDDLKHEIKLYDKELKNREVIVNNYKSNVINQLKNTDISQVTTIKKKNKSFLKKLLSLFK